MVTYTLVTTISYQFTEMEVISNDYSLSMLHIKFKLIHLLKVLPTKCEHNILIKTNKKYNF